MTPIFHGWCESYFLWQERITNAFTIDFTRVTESQFTWFQCYMIRSLAESTFKTLNGVDRCTYIHVKGHNLTIRMFWNEIWLLCVDDNVLDKFCFVEET